MKPARGNGHDSVFAWGAADVAEFLVGPRRDDLLPATPADAGTVVCGVCLEEFQPGDTMTELTCGHDFHDYCIDEWTAYTIAAEHRGFDGQGATCPTCRQPLIV